LPSRRWLLEGASFDPEADLTGGAGAGSDDEEDHGGKRGKKRKRSGKRR
jgi:hypothetical protein